MLKEFLHSTYSHLKGIKLCGNLLVRNIFTSDIRYLPGVMEQFGAAKLPKEMSFHVSRGYNFTDLYNFITFPAATQNDRSNVKESTVVNHSKKHHVICEPVGAENIRPGDSVPNRAVSEQSEIQGKKQSPVVSSEGVDNGVVKNRQRTGVGKKSHIKSSEDTKVRTLL